MGLVDSTTEEFDDVQRCFVCPMDIFDDENRRPHRAGEEFEECPERRVSIVLRQRFMERRLVKGHVPDRSQRPRCEKIIAAAPEHEDIALSFDRGINQCSLANTRLPAYQGHFPLAFRSSFDQRIEER